MSDVEINGVKLDKLIAVWSEMRVEVSDIKLMLSDVVVDAKKWRMHLAKTRERVRKCRNKSDVALPVALPKESEKEKGERNIPPVPPIRKEGKEKDKEKTETHARTDGSISAIVQALGDRYKAISSFELRRLRAYTYADADAQDALRAYIDEPPKLERALDWYARNFRDKLETPYQMEQGKMETKKWHEVMENAAWYDSHGKPIRNWIIYLNRWLTERRLPKKHGEQRNNVKRMENYFAGSEEFRKDFGDESKL